MDGAGGVLGARAAGNGPGPHLVLADGEEGDQPQQREGLTQHAIDGRLGETEVGEERLLLPSIAEMPAPPVRGGDVDAAPAAPGDTTERTLRELFWGED